MLINFPYFCKKSSEMRFKRFVIFFSYLLFWYLYFVVARIYFILFNLSEAGDASFWDLILTFVHGFRLDASMIGYVGFFAAPIFLISAFFKSHKVLKISLDIFTGILLAAFSLIVIGDAEVYKYWGFRLDDTPLQYLNTPGVMKASISNWRLVFLIFLYLDLAIGMFWIYYLTIGKKIKTVVAEKWWAGFYIIIAGTLFIPIRGGIGIVPINAGSAYFSDNMFLNHAAINVVWNSGTTFFAEEIEYSRYKYYEQKKADDLFAIAHESPDSIVTVIEKRPKKIVVVVLESFTKNAIRFDSIEKSVTPKLHKWANEGVLFDNFYANGDRSEKGIVSILSGLPTMPAYSIMKDPAKSSKLPALPKTLAANGYKTSFYYGGDINFANMQSYLKSGGVQKIVSKNNISSDCAQTEWGYHDECMFDIFYNDIVAEKDSSFSVLFTLSSHEPYDVPFVGPYGTKTESQRCMNAYYYTDSCLNDFLTKLEKLPDWNDMLVILVSDHGTRYGNVEVWDLPKFQIFMLWTGGAVSCEPFRYNHPGDQSDLSASLLGALKINHDEYIFSEDLFKKHVPNAFYAFNHGYAFVKGTRWVIYDINPDKFLFRGKDSEKLDEQAKAYAQKLVEYYEGLE
jgi:phosphoglycerol transferase MdoB-like AlkP superfamily enzyme